MAIPIHDEKPLGSAPRLKIVIDTREQRPWAFPEELAEVSRGTLNAGDYALNGDSFAIERKSLDDFVGTISREWERFCNELHRLAPVPARVVIVEAGLVDIISHRYRAPNIRPKFVASRIAELTLSGVSVLLCDNDVMAAGMAYRLFRWRRSHLDGAKVGLSHG